MVKTCAFCEKTDGMCYTSNPPKRKCTITGKFHEYDHICDVSITNADRIRAMSDEELAELFDGIVDNGRSCSLICGDLNECKRNNSIERICKNHYLKWLKQPAEGE